VTVTAVECGREGRVDRSYRFLPVSLLTFTKIEFPLADVPPLEVNFLASKAEASNRSPQDVKNPLYQRMKPFAGLLDAVLNIEM